MGGGEANDFRRMTIIRPGQEAFTLAGRGLRPVKTSGKLGRDGADECGAKGAGTEMECSFDDERMSH